MNIYQSLEVRWFLKKEPAGIVQLFQAKGTDVGHAGRTDEYARTNSDLFSLKFREGKLEIKMRTGAEISIGNYLATFWRKWSYPLDNTMEEPWKLMLENDRIQVKKQRALLYTDLASNEFMESVHSAEGCQWEYGHIVIRDENYFTFGLEAFGPDPLSMKCQLENGIRLLSELHLDVDLPTEAITDYPAFLAKR